ncbi:MAG: Mur ligase family protein, partial [Bacteroidota bacterium]
MSSYRETVDFLFNQLSVYQRDGLPSKKFDLKKIKQLCNHLGNPQYDFPTIHIAGTNGKGSTAHILSSILQAHGLRTGLYTSPHYRDFRERMKVNGKIIHRRQVVEFVDTHKDYFTQVQPSFFEVTFAMALDHFKARKVDVAIIETGLGGRLDSTNIINPMISIITNVSYDHQAILGDTLPEIAAEKAGIIKPETPVVIGEKRTDTSKVFNKVAKENDAPISYATDKYKVEKIKGSNNFGYFNFYENGELRFDNVKVNVGDYQYLNLTTAMEAIRVLSDNIRIKNIEVRESEQYEKAVKRLNYIARPRETVIRQGLANIKTLTNFMGRWQILGEKPLIVADSAHNEAGIALSLKQITAMKSNVMHIIIGLVRDKKHEAIMKLFPKEAKYYFTQADLPRALTPKELRAIAESVGLEG